MDCKIMIELLNIDCMEYMKGLEDNAFELAIVDPPYGIGFDGDSTLGNNKSKKWKNATKDAKKYDLKQWDKVRPSKEYFLDLARVSKKQIIWGGNYFADLLPPTGGYIYWDKDLAKGMSLSDGELAWTNAKNSVKQIKLVCSGFRKCEKTDRFHPTQKPVKLYEWLLSNYAKEGDRILDTHLGSGSSAIAAHYGGFDFVGCELDEDYFKAAQARFNKETAQLDIFQ
jgi:site-specific DNA-methyltransferase (adenine-specific)